MVPVRSPKNEVHLKIAVGYICSYYDFIYLMDCWPKVGYDPQNTSYAPEVSTPAQEVSPCWSLDLTSGLYTSPTIADGTVYLNYESEYYGDEPNVYALDAETGDTRWTVDLGRFGSFWTSPTVAGEMVFVLDESGAHCGNLLALDRADGNELWRAEGRFKHSAVVWDGRVYAGSEDGIVAIDTMDGEVVWDNRGTGKARATPAIDDESLFVPLGDSLRALDATTGALQWETDTGTGQTSPVVSDEMVFTGGKDGCLRAFDVDSGSIQWTHEREAQIYEPPAAAGDFVFFGSDDGYLHALATECGGMNWKTRLDEWVREVAYIDGSLYVCSWTKGDWDESGVYVLSPEDGVLRQKIEFETSPHTPVIAADGRLFVGTVNGLVALSG